MSSWKPWFTQLSSIDFLKKLLLHLLLGTQIFFIHWKKNKGVITIPSLYNNIIHYNSFFFSIHFFYFNIVFIGIGFFLIYFLWGYLIFMDLNRKFNKLTWLIRVFFSLIFLTDFFFQFHLSTFGWLGIKLCDLFRSIFYEIIIVS
jgi:hypothetical protein